MVMNPGTPQGPNQQNPYDFLSDSKKKPTPFSFLDAGSKKSRIIIAAAGTVILLLLASLAIGLIGGAGKADTVSLIAAAQQQNELIRLAEIGVSKSRGQEAKNIAITTKLTLQSQQSEMLNAVKMKNKKFSKKDLVSPDSKKHDEILLTAEQNNRFDEAFLSLMEEQLISYQQVAERAYRGAEGVRLKEALSNQYHSANILVSGSDTQTD